MVCAGAGVVASRGDGAIDCAFRQARRGHAQNHDWYKDLRQPDIGSRCCNGTVDGKQGDCRPAPSFLGEDGLYRAWDGREWLVVPKGKIITMPTPDRGTHLCETYGRVFCFITGEPVS